MFLTFLSLMVFPAINIVFLSKQIQLLHNKAISSFKVLQPYLISEPIKEFIGISEPIEQGISEPIKRILAEVGIRVAMKPHFTLSSIFQKPKDPIDFEEKRGLVYHISCRDCDAIYIGETRCSVKTRKREHVSAVRNFDAEKSALCQHV